MSLGGNVDRVLLPRTNEHVEADIDLGGDALNDCFVAGWGRTQDSKTAPQSRFFFRDLYIFVYYERLDFY